MKKIIYLSIAIASLSLVSCRDQDDMVQLDNQTEMAKPAAAAAENNAPDYGSFNSAVQEDGDPVKPPRD